MTIWSAMTTRTKTRPAAQAILAVFVCLAVLQAVILLLLNSAVSHKSGTYDGAALSLEVRELDACLADPTRVECTQHRNRMAASHENELKKMTFDIGHGQQTFLAYVQPHISSYYRQASPTESGGITKREKRMHFTGLAGKFLNLSPAPLRLFWDPGEGQDGIYIADAGPFEAVGTATFPSHNFYFAPKSDSSDIFCSFHVLPTTSLYICDPYDAKDANAPLASSSHRPQLDKSQHLLYTAQKQNLEFAKKYREFTGRDWLSFYPTRKPPIHYMWSADHFGQEHHVTTKETHFIIAPPDSDLERIKVNGIKRQFDDAQPRPLQQYRSTENDASLTMTLKVLSCAPRVFEIKNFLSDVEVHHILHLATGVKLSLSTTSGAEGGEYRPDTRTRTSYNSWLEREKSPIVDAVYRRAADLMHIDESLLRARDNSERPDLDFTSTVAEHLQLVHYAPGQEYTAHHDFSYPRMTRLDQKARFATLLLYLNGDDNDDLVGGETAFPRWRNSKSSQELRVKPVKGKAILFYSLLPDGNMDDLSQHSAKPVQLGEKWMINLWIWDPMF